MLGASTSGPGSKEPFEKQVWFTSLQLQVMAWLLCYPVTMAAALASTWVPNPDLTPIDPLVFVTFAILMVALVSAMAFRARVVVHGEHLIVVNTLVTWRVPVGAVAEVESRGLDRLHVRLRDGRVLKCWAIQATNAMLMAGRETRVDKVAVELREALARAPRALSEDAVRVVRSATGISWHALFLIAVYLGSAVNWFVMA